MPGAWRLGLVPYSGRASRAHTCFSYSDGAISAEALAKHARQLGYSHLGITDTADLGGLAKFAVEAMSPLKDPMCENAEQHTDEPCRACQYPVRPIVGAELNVDGYPMAFLARNEEGYCNLAALVTMARVGQWEEWDKKVQGKRRGRPKIRWEQLAEHAKGLHALTGPAVGRDRVARSRGREPRGRTGARSLARSVRASGYL